jgi:probable phosphoglycerate mutase
MELLLVRHALPARVELDDGPADPPLTDEGRRQAARLAAWLAAERLDAVWSSPLRRARETAEPLATAQGLEVLVDDDLAEWDRSSSSYVPIEELRAANDARFRALADGTWTKLWDVDPDGFRRSVVGAIERIVTGHTGEKVAVVCHGGVINAYMGHILGIDRLLFFHPFYGGINRIAASREGARWVLSINEQGAPEIDWATRARPD